jgi:hypothetical protein
MTSRRSARRNPLEKPPALSRVEGWAMGVAQVSDLRGQAEGLSHTNPLEKPACP